MKSLSKLTLLAALLCGGATAAWADETTIVGNEDNTSTWWTAFSPDYELEPNKTLTLSFTNYSGKGADWNNWVLICSNSGWTTRNVSPYYEYFVVRMDEANNYAWGEGKEETLRSFVYSKYYNTTNSAWEDYTASGDDFLTDMDGATVAMTVEREGSTVKVYADITTTASKQIKKYFRDYNVGDGTQNLRFTLSTELGHLVIDNTSISRSDTEDYVTGCTTIGKRDNSTLWWTDHSNYYTIAENGSLNLQFKNYTSKNGNSSNWLLVLTNDAVRKAAGYTEYLVLRPDHWAWTTNGGYKSREDNSWFTSIDSWYDWANFADDMNGSIVNMNISRSDAVATVRADILTTNGSTYYEKFVLNCGDGTGNLKAFLFSDQGHLVINDSKTAQYNTAFVSAYGWSTYCSSHALDFSGVEGLKAYMITDYSGTAVKLSEVTGTVPANTGLLLKGTANTYYDIPVVASSSTVTTNNKMVACHDWDRVVYAVDGKSTYVLSVNGGVAEFQKVIKVEGDETANPSATVDRGKAYLQFTGVVPAPSLQFDFSNPTAIEAIETTMKAQQGAFYNLNGQRVAQPQKGLYIVNGKKIFK